MLIASFKLVQVRLGQILAVIMERGITTLTLKKQNIFIFICSDSLFQN